MTNKTDSDSYGIFSNVSLNITLTHQLVCDFCCTFYYLMCVVVGGGAVGVGVVVSNGYGCNVLESIQNGLEQS